MSSTSPADLRELAARVERLIEDVNAAGAGLAHPVGFRLPDTVGWLATVVDDLGATADDLARHRSRPDDACSAEWGACPSCGNSLVSTGGRSRCRQCGNRWAYDRAATPCGERAAWLVRDSAGGEMRLCRGHLIDARKRLHGIRVESLPGGAALG